MGQDYDKYDVLIIDDGSTDNGLKLLRELPQEHIIIHTQKNSGVSATRNRALQFSLDHEYDAIAFLDADDYWQPDHLSSLLSLSINFPDASVFATNYYLKRARKTHSTKWSNFKDQKDQILEYFFEHNFMSCILSCSSVMITTSAIEKIGFFNEQYSHFEDIDWFIRIGMKVPVAFSFKTTVTIDESAANRSDQVALKERRFPDFTKYKSNITQHKGLEKYIDLNRFSIALAYRMENDIKNAAMYQQQIDLRNLTLKQQRLLQMSRLQLKSLKRTQKILGNLGLHLRAGD